MSRRATAIAAALAISFASVADNAASCREDGPVELGAGDGRSAPPPACAEMPCHTPVLVPAPPWPSPVRSPGRAVRGAYVEPVSADAPPPPTPPPMSRPERHRVLGRAAPPGRRASASHPFTHQTRFTVRPP